MPWKVVMIFAGTPLDPEEFRKMGAEFSLIHCGTEDEVIAASHDADVVITVLLPVTRRVISKLSKCRLIHNLGMGYEGVDIKAATDHGICVSYGADYCADEVAEHTMALILACARKIVRLHKAVREGKWDSPERKELRKLFSPMFRIKGQTLGLIGFGNIARRIVPKAKGFDLRVISFDPYVTSKTFDELGVEKVTLDYLLSKADYISVNCAMTQENKHMLGMAEFRKIKPTAYLINTARGGIVDEQALYTALTHGYIAGAGLDVLEKESVSLDDPLLKLDNVILTAHASFYSEQSTSEVRRRAYEQVGQVLRGEWPTYFLNPEVKTNFVKKWGSDE